MRKPPHYIAVEGPMRVGKTKLARALEGHFRGRSVLDVPCAPHLEAFYQGRPCADFRTQIQFLYQRFDLLRAARIRRSQLPVISDFLFEKDKIYACLNLDDDELEVYDTYYRHFKEQLPDPDLAVYLRATAEVLHERLAADSSGPESNVSAAYLDGTVRAFDHFFSRYESADILVVDTAKTDVMNRPEDLTGLLQEISRPVVGTQFFLPLGS